jgi:hypothetical protein
MTDSEFEEALIEAGLIKEEELLWKLY